WTERAGHVCIGSLDRAASASNRCTCTCLPRSSWLPVRLYGLNGAEVAETHMRAASQESNLQPRFWSAQRGRCRVIDFQRLSPERSTPAFLNNAGVGTLSGTVTDRRDPRDRRGL